MSTESRNPNIRVGDAVALRRRGTPEAHVFGYVTAVSHPADGVTVYAVAVEECEPPKAAYAPR